MGSTRIKGNALYFKLGDTSGTDYWADCTNVVLENEEDDSGVTTFEDAANAGTERKWHFTLSGIQSTANDSFWRYLWENTGEEVAFTYAPHGNETPSTDKPHFLGTVKIKEKPSVGGEASEDGEFTFDYQLDVETGPTLDDGSTP